MSTSPGRSSLLESSSSSQLTQTGEMQPVDPSHPLSKEHRQTKEKKKKKGKDKDKEGESAPAGAEAVDGDGGAPPREKKKKKKKRAEDAEDNGGVRELMAPIEKPAIPASPSLTTPSHPTKSLSGASLDMESNEPSETTDSSRGAHEKKTKAEAFSSLAKRIFRDQNEDNVGTFLVSYTLFTNTEEMISEWLEEFNSALSLWLSTPVGERLPVKITVSQRLLRFLLSWLDDYAPSNMTNEQAERLLDAVRRDPDTSEDSLARLRKALKQCTSSGPAVTRNVDLGLTAASSARAAALETGTGTKRKKKNMAAGAGLPGVVGGKSRHKTSTKDKLVGTEDVLTEAEFERVSAKDLAQELTLIEFDLFAAVKMDEMLDMRWKKEDRLVLSPGVCAMVDRFNETSYWVVTRLLTTAGGPKKIAEFVLKYIEIAKAARTLNNFNLAMEIVSGLNVGAISRLRNVWQLVPAGAMADLDELNTLLSASNNFVAYREALKAAAPPMIPYFGLFLRDLTFIYEANDTYLDSGLVNFDMLLMVYLRMRDMLGSQRCAYDFGSKKRSLTPVLLSLPCIEDDDHLFALSQQVQPTTLVLDEDGTDHSQGEDSTAELMITVPAEYREAVDASKDLLSRHFDRQAFHSPEQGTIDIAGDRYLVLRAHTFGAALLRRMRESGVPADFRAPYLFDLGYLLGHSIAAAHQHAGGRLVGLEGGRFVLGLMQLNYMGWAQGEILPRSKLTPDRKFVWRVQARHTFQSEQAVAEGRSASASSSAASSSHTHLHASLSFSEKDRDGRDSAREREGGSGPLPGSSASGSSPSLGGNNGSTIGGDGHGGACAMVCGFLVGWAAGCVEDPDLVGSEVTCAAQGGDCCSFLISPSTSHELHMKTEMAARGLDEARRKYVPTWKFFADVNRYLSKDMSLAALLGAKVKGKAMPCALSPQCCGVSLALAADVTAADLSRADDAHVTAYVAQALFGPGQGDFVSQPRKGRCQLGGDPAVFLSTKALSVHVMETSRVLLRDKRQVADELANVMLYRFMYAAGGSAVDYCAVRVPEAVGAGCAARVSGDAAPAMYLGMLPFIMARSGWGTLELDMDKSIIDCKSYKDFRLYYRMTYSAEGESHIEMQKGVGTYGKISRKHNVAYPACVGAAGFIAGFVNAAVAQALNWPPLLAVECSCTALCHPACTFIVGCGQGNVKKEIKDVKKSMDANKAFSIPFSLPLLDMMGK